MMTEREKIPMRKILPFVISINHSNLLLRYSFDNNHLQQFQDQLSVDET